MNILINRKWYCISAGLLLFGFSHACNMTTSSKNAEVQRDTLEIESNITLVDTVLTVTIVKTEELQCDEWKEPSKDEIIPLLYTLSEVTGREWNDCYGDWNCGIEGELMYKGKKCYYRLDAGGWIILRNGSEQRYFVCKSDSCWNTYPSECFCDDEGKIIDSP